MRFFFDLPRLSENLDFDVRDNSRFDLSYFIKQLKEKIAQVNPQILRDDLTPLFSDSQFVNSFSQNINKIFTSHLRALTEDPVAT